MERGTSHPMTGEQVLTLSIIEDRTRFEDRAEWVRTLLEIVELPEHEGENR